MKLTKPCKGINKAHGYEGCGNEVPTKERVAGLCRVCYWDWMQSTEGGRLHYQTQFIPRVKKLTEKENKKKTKEQRESLKSISRLIQEARVPFQKWIRLRDANEPCISCGTTTAKIWHSGHYLKAELFTGLIFHLINVNKQCEKCNTFLNGNESVYRIGLVKKYGEEVVKELEELADRLRQYKFTREELKIIKSKYQKLLRCKHQQPVERHI